MTFSQAARYKNRLRSMNSFKPFEGLWQHKRPCNLLAASVVSRKAVGKLLPLGPIRWVAQNVREVWIPRERPSDVPASKGFGG